MFSYKTMERVYHQELCTEDASKDCYTEKRNILSEESLKRKKKELRYWGT